MSWNKLFPLVMACFLPASGLAGTITFIAAPPTIAAGATGKAQLFWGFGKVGGMRFGNNPLASTNLTAADTASTKAAKLLASMPPALVTKYTAFILGSFPNEIRFGSPNALADGIVFTGTGTGELNDGFRVQGDDATLAFINWVGPFAATDANGLATQFTVGIGDDLGSVTSTLPAAAFASLSDGSFIASTFYDTLSTQLSSIGVAMVDTGAELDFTFADGVASNGAEFDFGTTSGSGVLTAGIIGTTTPEPNPIALVGLGLGFFMLLRREVIQRHAAWR